MSTSTSQPLLRPLRQYEPRTRHATSATTIPAQQRPDGQLSLRLWAEPGQIVTEPVTSVDEDKLTAVLTAIVEVCDGSRSLDRVRAALHPSVYQQLAERRGRSRRRYRLIRAHARTPREGVVEACGLVRSGDRALAMCALFEQGEHGWLCTEFTIMEPRALR